MASESSNTISFFIALVWTFLSLVSTKLKNPKYEVVFPTMAAIAALFTSTGITFAPGLLDVVQSATPPSINFFKSLPTTLLGVWAVYLLVLEKDGCMPAIYIGSGTALGRSVLGRLQTYNNEDANSIPRYVRQALQDGFKITHKGLLCWVPIPEAGNIFHARVVILALESVLSVLLWAMKSKTKLYGMPLLCPWPLEELGYNGLCSHNAIMEGIPGEVDGLNEEELAAYEAAVLERATALKKSYSKKYNAKLYAEKKHACADCGKLFLSKLHLDLHKATNKHKNNASGVVKVPKQPHEVREENQTWRDANKASEKYFCTPCQKSFGVKQHLEKHRKTKRHTKAVAAARLAGKATGENDVKAKTYKHAEKKTKREANMAAKKYYCSDCKSAFGASSALTKHRKSQKHKDQVNTNARGEDAENTEIELVESDGDE